MLFKRLFVHTIRLISLLLVLWIPSSAHGDESEPFVCDVSDFEDAGSSKGTFMANLWSSHVIPYDFVEESNTAVNTYTGTDIHFINSSPPTIVCPPDSFQPKSLTIGDEIQVLGSNSNDIYGGVGYVVTATTNSTITLRPEDTLVNEAAGATVIVYSTRSVIPSRQTAFEQALLEWETVADVDFVRRTSQTDYVLVRNSNRNRSDVGQRGTGAQDLQMRLWGNKFVMVHELGHTLGVKHEQSRTDRDTYVRIDSLNVDPDFIGNFNIVWDSNAYPIGPHAIYDFGSVMHYGAKSFSINGQDTIVVREPWNAQWQASIGQKDSLSIFDCKTMSFLYPEGDWKFVYASAPSTAHLGTLHDPYTGFSYAESRTPVGGRLIILYPDVYDAVGVYSEAKLISAPIGGAVLR